ncbi:N-acetylmuramoyl-L-alanine amidase [Numidum massiliense]|uniref:N-acetylmuramoyl-L-alanine amidase n=1 Tax=Numidum massiliense TaxID=1522315 RepID=UPI0006D538A6|nr:N-acetylmuramoyl-L-alanine amidase [Numidum massiliense]
MIKFMIDGGHGGTDPGAVANGLKEKDITLAIALRIRDILFSEYEGVAVKMSRTTDKTVPLSAITNAANAWAADFLLSIHINAGGGTGFESFTYNGINDVKTNSIQKNIHTAVAKVIGIPDRGIKKADLHVCRESYMPALLTECGFIDSKTDSKLMKSKAWIDRVARAHVEGLAKSFGIKKKKNSGGSKKPTPVKPKPGDKLHRVQIGAYANKKNADAAAAKAKKVGFDAVIKKEGSLYKVQIGAFRERKNAGALATRAKKAKFDVTISYN